MTDVKLNKDGSVPKKRGRPKVSKTTTPAPKKENKQTETQFKKGEPSANPNGARVNFRRPTIDMRTTMHNLIQQAAMPMLVNLLYDSYEQKDRKDMLSIIEFMFKYSYGTPREMHDYEELDNTNHNPSTNPIIMISREDLLKNMDEDEKYV